MRFFRRLVSRLRGMLTQRISEEQMHEEIEQHLALQIEENLRAGMSPTEARRQARLLFGPIEAIKDNYREQQRLPILETIVQDVRLCLRNMRQSPGFTTVVLLTLALGIGGNTAIFSVINGILIEHLPYTDASRLLLIRRGQIAWGISLNELQAIQQECPALESSAVFRNRYIPFTIGETTLRRQVTSVSAEFFQLLGVKPIIGRILVPEDHQPGRAPAAVLSHRLWMDAFGGDPHVIGREILADKTSYSIVGVMPMRFELGVDWSGDAREGFWIPIPSGPVDPARRGSAGSEIIARLKPGVAREDAIAQVQPIAHRFPESYPKDAEDLQFIGKSPGLSIAGDVRSGLFILQAAIGFVLLIVSVNISALLVARAWARRREFAIRCVLGASRQRIIQQLMTESVVLAAAGGALGLLFSRWATGVVRTIAPLGTPRLDRLQIDSNVLWFTAGVSLLSAILFGLLPAIQSSTQGIAGNFTGTGMVQGQRRWLRSGLLISEVALAAILVVGATLMLRSFNKLMRVDTGVHAEQVLTTTVQLSDSTCGGSGGRARCMLTARNILDGVRSLPGIEEAALSSGGPFSGGFDWRAGLITEGSAVEQPFDGMGRRTSPGYFMATGIRLLAGRDFVASDPEDAAIVSETFARRYFSGNALGKRFSTYKDGAGSPVWMEVVGEVNDTRDRTIRPEPSRAIYYQPFTFANGSFQVIARAAADTGTLVPAIGRVVRSVDMRAETDVKALSDLLYESAGQSRFQTALLCSFAVLAFLLAVIGIYGVTGYSVVQRSQEIGIRLALGAGKRDVMRLIVGNGSLVALTGIAFGLAGAVGLTRFLTSMLFDVTSTDIMTYLSVAVLLFIAALTACYLPARRALRIDPIVVLRHD